MDALSIQRFSHYLYKKRIPLIPKLVQTTIFFLFNSYLPYQLRVGNGTRLGHRGISVVINGDAVIGCDVLIRAHVTIGKKSEEGAAPVIGDNVTIGDGAKILGDVRVGEGAVIGANAVVVHDVAPGSVVVGIPAKPLEKRS